MSLRTIESEMYKVVKNLNDTQSRRSLFSYIWVWSKIMTSLANTYPRNQFLTMISFMAMDMSVKLEHFTFRLIRVADRL